MSDNDSRPAVPPAQSPLVDVKFYINYRKRRITLWTILCMTYCIVWCALKCYLFAFDVHKDELLSLQEREQFFTIELLIVVAYLYCFYTYLFRLWEEVPAEFARTTPENAAGFSLFPIVCWFWWFTAFVGLHKDMNKTMESYGFGTRFGTAWIRLICVCWLVFCEFVAPACQVAISPPDGSALDVRILLECIVSLITIMTLWIVRNNVLKFVDLKTHTTINGNVPHLYAQQHDSSLHLASRDRMMWTVVALAFCSFFLPSEDSTFVRELASEAASYLPAYGVLIVSVIIGTITNAIIGATMRLVTKKQELTAKQKEIKIACVQLTMIASFIAIACFWEAVLVSHIWFFVVIMIAVWLGMMWDRSKAKRQFQLGMCFYRFGTPEDVKEAVRSFHRSADYGDSEAQYMLGTCYCQGKGVPQNKKKALKWYRQAAEQGHERAKEFLDQLKK